MIIRKITRIIGLMSGTSADGVDAAIIDINKNKVNLLAFKTYCYPSVIRKLVLQAGEQSICRPADISNLNFLLGHFFAEAAIMLCKSSGISIKSIDLIGSHGQTIYHNPKGLKFANRKISSTFQIGEPSVIAQRTGVTTVADFRPRDMAAGGEGAPLVPFADYFLLRHKKKNRAIQNIGGIANVTYLPACCRLKDIIAFDTGPGNMIIDKITNIISNGKLNYDKGGKIAAQGNFNAKILYELLRHPYFSKKPPKSTGREEFGREYCNFFLKKAKKQSLSPQDILATAVALTASSIAGAYRKYLPKIPDQIILCGGGAHNTTLVKMLEQKLSSSKICLIDDFGISCDAKEAVSFAILAHTTFKGMTNNVPSATGAEKKVILGKIIPA